MTSIEHHTLLAYLYKELSDEEAAQVTDYLATHPEAQATYAQLQATHRQLQQLKDVPVPQPLVFPGRQPRLYSGAWQKWAAAAAVVMVGVLAAAWLEVRIRYANQELSIRFGEPPVLSTPLTPPQLTQTPVEVEKTAFSSGVTAPDTAVLRKLAALEQRLQQQIEQLRHPPKTAGTRASDGQLTGLLNQMQQDNYQLMQQLVATATLQQQRYSEQLLNQLTFYLARQREDDLQQINMALNTIIQSTDQNLQQTDRVLIQLIARLQENEKNRYAK